MADALGITASIIAVVQISTAVVDYVLAYKDASEDQARLVAQLGATTGILTTLKNFIDAQGEQEWLQTSASLFVQSGPIDQFNATLKVIADKIISSNIKLQDTISNLTWPLKMDQIQIFKRELRAITKDKIQQLKWPFREKKVAELVRSLEWQLSLFTLALQNDST